MNDQQPLKPGQETAVSRRGFVRCAAAMTFGTAWTGMASPVASAEKPIPRDLSPAVQMQFMRPAQLEKAIRDFPVVYVPFGLIEWHGRHLPLGNDALKAHAILVKAAEQGGGAVYPPVYFHDGFPRSFLVPVLTAQAIAKRARELLEALPASRESSPPRSISPGQ